VFPAVFERRIVLVCTERDAVWVDGSDEPGCADATHEHLRFEIHVHRTPVELPDGTTVAAASFDDRDPYVRDVPPEFGLYLDARWRPPWPHDVLDWPDFGVPEEPAPLLDALRELLRRARDGERVELGCLGGHGRTGTALAGLAVLTGIDPDHAVDWVRSASCDQAVETPEQEVFVRSLRP
jgi:hypothetical protein